MEHYETIYGTKKLNEYITLGWELNHTFTKLADFTEAGFPGTSTPAFVVVWKTAGVPQYPQKPAMTMPTPEAPTSE